MADRILIEYQASVEGLKADLSEVSKIEAKTREQLEKPIEINANTKDLKDALKAIAAASGDIRLSNIDKEIDAIVTDSKKLKQLFDELASSAAGMKKGSAEYNALQQIMGSVDAQIKLLTKDTKTFEDTSVTATKSLRTQLKEAQADVARLSDEFGATSQQAIAAAKRAAELKDAIGDAKALTDAFNPDAKFNALTSSLGGALGGFQAYEGALALIGSESEDLQRTLVKLQAVMALSQGLQQLGEAKDSFKQLGAVIKDQVSGAFTTLRGAIAATGLGLLVIAIGAIVANWRELVGWIEKTFPSIKKVTDFFKNFQQISSGVINGVIAGFKTIGKIAADIFAGDFSKAFAEAKNLGKNVATAYNQGFAQKDAELKRKQAMKDNKLQIDLLEAQGKDVKGSRLKYAQEELKDLQKGSDDYNEKLIEIEEIRTQIREDGAKKREEQAKRAEEKRKAEIERLKKLEEDNNKKVIENRDKLIAELDKKQIEDKKVQIGQMEAQNLDKSLIEKEKLELLRLEEDYNNKVYTINVNAFNKLQGVYSDTKKAAEKEIVALNETLKQNAEQINNSQITLDIKSILDVKPAENLYDDIIAKEKEIKSIKATSKIQELENERSLNNLQNERYQRELDFITEKKAKLDALLISQGVNPLDSIDSQKLADEIKKVKEKIEGNSENAINIDLKINQENANILKAQINELFQFANQGLLVEIGLDPQSVNNFKLGIEGLASTLSATFATEAEKVKAILDATANLMQASFQLASQALFAGDQQAIEERRVQLQEEEQRELEQAGQNEQQKSAIKQKYLLKEKELKRKEAENDKKKAIFDALIAGGVAIIKAAPNPFLIAATAALTAFQVGLIQSRPIPKFKDGVLSFDGKGGLVGGVGTGTSDSNLAYLSRGESVIPAAATKRNMPLIESLINGDSDKFIEQNMVLPRLKELAESKKKQESDMLNIQNLMIQNAIKNKMDVLIETNVKTNKILNKNNTNFSL